MSTKVTLHGPDGWTIELDQSEVNIVDPGSGTPAMVYGPAGQHGTYSCAIGAGEVCDDILGDYQIPGDVYSWIERVEDQVHSIINGFIDQERLAAS